MKNIIKDLKYYVKSRSLGYNNVKYGPNLIKKLHLV